ncbi:MAG TPA: hypothetical protein DCE44_03655 [Verrucomicrobiales bacterium]|nr:hypothetical protein [Verrucomicrobiales bacterium]
MSGSFLVALPVATGNWADRWVTGRGKYTDAWSGSEPTSQPRHSAKNGLDRNDGRSSIRKSSTLIIRAPFPCYGALKTISWQWIFRTAYAKLTQGHIPWAAT